MKLKMIIGMFLFLNSFSVFSDTYPVVTTSYYWTNSGGYHTASSAIALCNTLGDLSVYHFVASGSYCNGYRNSDNGSVGSFGQYNGPVATSTCPGGGTVSGSNCINAPVCITPQVRSTVGQYIGMCVTLIECAYPETDQGNGICENITCSAGQNRNPVSKACQTPPTCGSTQAYDIITNTCFLKPLNCPGHTHANTANDSCLSDAPLACPAGEHDDGTYNCVADTKAPCTSAQQSGYINGVHQCIKKTNAEQAASDLAIAKTTQQATQLAADTAAAALAADPNNTTKQAANTAAQAANVTAQANVTIAKNDADSKTLQSIDQSLKSSGINTDIAPNNDVEGLDAALKPAGPSFGTSAIDSMSFVDAVDFNPNSTECQGVPMHYKMLNYDFDPCEKLALFRNLFGWFAYVWTAFSIVQIARRVD